jgi:hypothetical protein
MWIRVDNQDVGSEAAIIERVRNSSLVKWICAENSAGLKLGTEAADLEQSFGIALDGRGAFCPLRRSTVRTAGADGSANVGMSSEM